MASIETKRRVSDWFRQWRDPLRRYLLGRVKVRPADVEDIGQEVFLRLLRYRKAELVEHPQAYLYKIASHVATEWSIRAASRSLREARWLETLQEGEQPDDTLLRTQVTAEIKRALSTLSPRQREVLRLFFSEGLGHAQIAERTGESLRTVRRHFARGYQKLRHELDPELLKAYENGAMSHGRD